MSSTVSFAMPSSRSSSRSFSRSFFRTISVTGVLVLGACSGGDASPVTDTVAPSTAPATSTTVADAAAAGAATESDATLADDATEWTVAVDVRSSGFEGQPIDTTVSWSGDPASLVEDGPFGRFGACSGLRGHVGAYSVLVSGDGELDAVSVWTAERVTAAGVYDAEVRIERAGSAPISASGTMTIDDGLQEGEFQAFGPSGGEVAGTFSCLGTVPPTPLSATGLDGDGELDAVEVFALLQDGDAERILGLAADGSSGAECAALGQDSSSTVVRVDGDAVLGGLTAFELTDEPSVTARLRAGGASYEFDDVMLRVDDSGASGVFSGVTAEGVSVDGAFRCT